MNAGKESEHLEWRDDSVEETKTNYLYIVCQCMATANDLIFIIN